MNTPTITPDDAHLDGYYINDNLEHEAREFSKRMPGRYQNATVEHPELVKWVTTVVDLARKSTTPNPIITEGPSILILGNLGVGKTHQACGAIRALTLSGAACDWDMLTAADLYARLRPRPYIDPEQEFADIASSGILILDDIGAAKSTEWTEEVNYRLINHRYQWMKPTIITSNVPPNQLGQILGQRVASRLLEMTTHIVIDGPDRRRQTP